MNTIDEIDEIILKEIAKKPVNTYRLAKNIGLSWSAIHNRCYKLVGMNKITLEYISIGRKQNVWQLKIT